MKTFFVLSLFFAACFAVDEYCYNDVIGACSPRGGSELKNCNAKYGAIESIASDLQSYANKHITHSFQYLLMSTHFGNFEKNRVGFEKLFKKLSDTAWHDGIELIKYLGKRGSQMNFGSRKTDKLTEMKDDTYELNELGSLARALDIQKSLAEEAHHIHGEVTRKREAYHDPETSSFIENHFVHQHRDIIRDLSGHTNDLKSLIADNKQSSLAVFLFDEYLQKS